MAHAPNTFFSEIQFHRRKNMVFLGGSVLADIMKDQDEFWITKEQWKELGADRAISAKHRRG